MAGNTNSVEKIDTDLDIDEQIGQQEKGWVIQRIGWVLIIGVMIMGALGLFGGGWLSKKKLTAENVTAEYEKFFRFETEMPVLVESSEHISSISFDQNYLKHFRIVRFVPEPINNNTLQNQIRFNFLPANNLIVTVYLIPKNYGTIQGLMKVNEVKEIKLNHFIFP